MRSSETALTGNIGEADVHAELTRFGWGVIPVPQQHDLGTDFMVNIRDERRFDEGRMLGVQVKGGPSWFSEPCRDGEGNLTGWWFRDEDRSHIDYWLGHVLPHIIVLRNTEENISYWAHVDRARVISTGQGAKILVPVTQRLVATERDNLHQIAAAQRSPHGWEGSSWAGAPDLRPADVWRHALVTPRLVAPHPNRSRSSALNPAQALAVLVTGGLWDYERRATGNAEMPPRRALATHSDWKWRFVGAMEQRVAADCVDQLRAVIADAPDIASHTAAGVALACYLLEKAQPNEAITVLEDVLAKDAAEPVDHAWLLTQLARAHSDVNRLEQARDLAGQALRARGTHPEDASATAIATGAAAVLFAATPLGEEDLAATIRGTDTVATWWRAQTMSRGLSAVLKRAFWQWCRDTTDRWSASDDANDQLLSAMLLASHCGDAGSQRSVLGLLAREHLLRTDRRSDPSVVAGALNELRLAGSKDAVTVAVRDRLVHDGPIAAVSTVLSEVDLSLSTRSTHRSDLALLQFAGDLMPEAAAERAGRWILATLVDPSPFQRRCDDGTFLEYNFVNALAQVIPSAPGIHREVIDYVLAMAPLSDDFRANPWAQVVRQLPPQAWDVQTSYRALQVASGHSDRLKSALLQAALPHHGQAREALLEQVRVGSYDALSFFNVPDLPTDVVTEYVSRSVGRLQSEAEQAASGVFPQYGVDHAEVLTLLNLWHPGAGDWEALIAFLRNPQVAGKHKRQSLNILSGACDRIPSHHRPALIQATRGLLAPRMVDMPLVPADHFDASGAALQLSVALQPASISEHWPYVVNLASGDAAARIAAAQTMTRAGGDIARGFLLGMCADENPRVRAAAAVGVLLCAPSGNAQALVAAVLEGIPDDTGRSVPLEAARFLSDQSLTEPRFAQLATRLRAHPSAVVRRLCSAVPLAAEPAAPPELAEGPI